MMKKEDIVEIINGYVYKEDAETPKIIEERDFENIATEIAKLFAIPVVINCPICGGETHQICYKCTKELCSPLKID